MSTVVGSLSSDSFTSSVRLSLLSIDCFPVNELTEELIDSVPSDSESFPLEDLKIKSRKKRC